MHGRVEWFAIIVPAVLVGAFEFMRHQVLLWTGPWGNLLSALVVAATVYGFVRFFARLIRRTTAELTRVREQAAVMSERQRIARDMHDGVAQAMFYLNVKLDRLDQLLGAGRWAEARQELEAVRGHMRETYAQVRAVIADLKEAALPEDLAGALQAVVGDFAARTRLQPELRVRGDRDLSRGELEHLAAIVQEALHNAYRHGQATRVSVECEAGPWGLRVLVRDNGRGFAPAEAGGGFGLAIMSERARALGGRLDVRSRPRGGCEVELRVENCSLEYGQNG